MNRPARDTFAQEGKRLASTVQRIRGWVRSDPARTPELADALVALTDHRLRGHAYLEAVSEAQESVSVSGQLLSAHGPPGPYTPPADASRYLTTGVHLAAVQTGLGLEAAADRTLGALQTWLDELPGLPVVDGLAPRTTFWALWSFARAALAAGDVATANAAADTALAVLARAGLGTADDDTQLAVDAHRLVADTRWAAGWTTDAVAHQLRAKHIYDALVGGRLAQPAGLSPALVARLAEPLFGLSTDLADRLIAVGDLDRGLRCRRDLIAALHGLEGRLEPVRSQLARALADLAEDLLLGDRLEEAWQVADEAHRLATKTTGARTASLRLQVAAVAGRVLTGSGRAEEAVALLEGVAAATADDDLLDDAYVLALAALVEAQRQRGASEADEAERSLAAARAALTTQPSWSAPVDVPALTVARDRARGVVSHPVHRLPGWAPLSADRTFGAGPGPTAVPPPRLEHRTADEETAERAEAHRLELEREAAARAEAARLAEEEQAAARQAAAVAEQEQRQRAEAARREAERRAAEEEAARLETRRRREERLAAHRVEVERREAERQAAERRAAEADELEAARQALTDARASGDRRTVRVAVERVVELLRPRAATDPERFGRELVSALRELSTARLKSGDWWGSRAPAKEAKALAAALERGQSH